MAGNNVIDIEVGEGNETSLHCAARSPFFGNGSRSCKASCIPCIGILKYISVRGFFFSMLNDQAHMMMIC